jgi:hypothetical protein
MISFEEREEDQMATLWLLKGSYEAPGWRDLERDARADKIDVVLFDRLAWALLSADEAPEQYEGLVPGEPPDGLYIDANGVPVYVVERREVAGPREVIAALGRDAEEMLEKIGDPDTVLERLGRAY